MPKQKPSQLFASIKPEIEKTANAFYGGNLARGFLHWSISEILFEEELSDIDIKDTVIIDGPDDQGVDGYWPDEDGKVIHIIQAKYMSNPGRAIDPRDLVYFDSCLERVLNPFTAHSSRNDGVRELHEKLLALLPLGFTIHLIFVTTGSVPEKRKGERLRSSTQTIKVADKDAAVTINFEFFDLVELASTYEDHLRKPRPAPKVKFELEAGAFHGVAGNFRAINFTVPVGQLIRAFVQHKYDILRLNPRGPLKVKTNQEIRKSLENPSTAHIFHILNNGISAICDSYAIEDENLKVDNFQIVNGCQTTFTLYKARTLVAVDSEVKVNIKLTECPEAMHRTIAIASNTQARLKAEDLVSTDETQLELQRRFERLSPRWFYEIKRGEWASMVPEGEKQRYKDNGGYRVLRIKEAAQAALAFVGKPGEAKDRPRRLFERRMNEGYYEDIFEPVPEANQLLLPVSMLREIQQHVNEAANQQGYEGDPTRDWLTYARLHLLWLMGKLIRGRYQLTSEGLLELGLSAQLCDQSIRQKWFGIIYGIAHDAINDAANTRISEQKYPGHREFFRSTSSYEYLENRLDAALERERRWARSRGQPDPLSVLPEITGG